MLAVEILNHASKEAKDNLKHHICFRFENCCVPQQTCRRASDAFLQLSARHKTCLPAMAGLVSASHRTVPIGLISVDSKIEKSGCYRVAMTVTPKNC
jgi:hypothetical protein